MGCSLPLFASRKNSAARARVPEEFSPPRRPMFSARKSPVENSISDACHHTGGAWKHCTFFGARRAAEERVAWHTTCNQGRRFQHRLLLVLVLAMAELDSTLPLSSHSSSAAAHAPAWLETAALTALALTAGALVGGRDALVLRPELAWLALAPLLAGLRSGPGHGVACAAAQAGALLAAAHWGNAVAEVSLGQLALAWVIAGLLAGWFRDAWMRRLGQAEAQETSLRGQLDVL